MWVGMRENVGQSLLRLVTGARSIGLFSPPDYAHERLFVFPLKSSGARVNLPLMRSASMKTKLKSNDISDRPGSV